MSRKRSSRASVVSGQEKKNSFVWVEIDLNNLRNNFRILRSIAKRSGAQILAIVKADAYGHGMTEVARTLSEEGVDFFGVATLDEALRLRESRRKEKVLVLGSFHPNQVLRYVGAGIRPTLSSIEDLKGFEKNLPTGKRYPVHVKVDTGMGRLGVWHADAQSLFEELGRSNRVELEGVYTHFSSADEKKADFTQIQMNRFEAVIRKVRAMGFKPHYVHAANSLGMSRFKYPQLNLVRPGILLYGLNPAKSWTVPRGLKPVMSLKAQISFLKKVYARQPLSYGRTYQTSRETYIATLPIGYSHGYRVGFSNKGQVLVKGRRCPVVGRVTMDQTLVDVGSVPGVRRWETVTLLGGEGKGRVSAEELAEIAGTIPYEIVCGIHSRIPRFYKGLKSATERWRIRPHHAGVL